mmetsp:Transcript_47014/g.155824  ORF Transcript_47014/g.155824 Transcript_47014/m.155824 type:complete len:254 (+) Transcript_47014:386-1147(+)
MGTAQPSTSITSPVRFGLQLGDASSILGTSICRDRPGLAGPFAAAPHALSRQRLAATRRDRDAPSTVAAPLAVGLRGRRCAPPPAAPRPWASISSRRLSLAFPPRRPVVGESAAASGATIRSARSRSRSSARSCAAAGPFFGGDSAGTSPNAIVSSMSRRMRRSCTSSSPDEEGEAVLADALAPCSASCFASVMIRRRCAPCSCLEGGEPSASGSLAASPVSLAISSPRSPDLRRFRHGLPAASRSSLRFSFR